MKNIFKHSKKFQRKTKPSLQPLTNTVTASSSDCASLSKTVKLNVYSPSLRFLTVNTGPYSPSKSRTSALSPSADQMYSVISLSSLDLLPSRMTVSTGSSMVWSSPASAIGGASNAG